MSHLEPKFIGEIAAGYLKLFDDFGRFQGRVIETVDKLKNQKARDYCQYGIGRRNNYIQDCLYLFFHAFEQEAAGKKITTSLRTRQTIHLNMFFFCLTGGLDNLAWVFAKEGQFEIDRRQTTIWSKKIQKHLPNQLRTKVKKFEKWNQEHLTDFRDASAHRIMPYVIPYLETSKRRIYESWYMHDFDSKKQVRLHPQVIADTGAYMEIVTAGIKCF